MVLVLTPKESPPAGTARSTYHILHLLLNSVVKFVAALTVPVPALLGTQKPPHFSQSWEKTPTRNRGVVVIIPREGPGIVSLVQLRFGGLVSRQGHQCVSDGGHTHHGFVVSPRFLLRRMEPKPADTGHDRSPQPQHCVCAPALLVLVPCFSRTVPCSVDQRKCLPVHHVCHHICRATARTFTATSVVSGRPIRFHTEPYSTSSSASEGKHSVPLPSQTAPPALLGPAGHGRFDVV